MASDILLDDSALHLQADQRVSVAAKTVDFRSASNEPSVRVSTIAGQISIYTPGDGNHESGLFLRDDRGAPVVRIAHRGVDADELALTRVFLDGAHGNLTLGGDGADGDVLLRDQNGAITAHISGATARDANAHQVAHPSAKLQLNAVLGLYNFGGVMGGRLSVNDRENKPTVQIDGARGLGTFRDIRLSGDDGVHSLKAEIKELKQAIAALQARLGG